MNDVTPAQQERLNKFVEECSEGIKEAAKTLNHGWCPQVGELSWDNKEALEREIGDIEAAIQLLKNQLDIDPKKVAARKAAKLLTITRYMKHQG
jgi:NTP pyrophosphatase (non-canonical NTP hydrolase)